MNDINNFSKQIPNEISQVCQELWEKGCSVCVVGGVARDFLLKRGELLDWDFEIRSRDKNNNIEELMTSLFPNIQSLGFGVYRLTLNEKYQLEFSIPRIEKFPVESNQLQDHPLSHKDFEVELAPNSSFKESFLRRDLTINAIGFDYNDGNWDLVDPFGGLADLENSIARPCSHDFIFDPVRYLRALRFEILFNLDRSSELDGLLSKMNLSLATDHYLLYESMKAGFFPFMRLLFTSLTEHDVDYPETWSELSFLKENSIEAKFTSADQLLMYAAWLSDWNLSDLGKLERFLKLRRGRAKHFLTGKDFFNKILEINWDDKTKEFKNMPWEEKLNNQDFLELFEAYKHFDSWTQTEEDNLIFLFDEKRTFSNWRNFFPRTLSGKDLFDQNQKKENVSPSQRAWFKLHCHIIT